MSTRQNITALIALLFVPLMMLTFVAAAQEKTQRAKARKSKKAQTSPQPILPDGETILASMYTVHRGVLKMTVIMDFESEKLGGDVTLEVKKKGKWLSVGKSPIIVDGYSTHFRVNKWDHSQDTLYCVLHGKSTWQGTIRRDPTDKETIVIAGFTGNAGGNNKEDIVKHVGYINPDLLVFTGDQVYGNDHRRNFPNNFCMPFRTLLRDIPSILLPDDHDVGQGNLWGDAGENYSNADYTRMVQRVQVGHLPDPYDPTPVGQGIGVYYTSLNIGRVSVAIIEDRKFKSDYTRFFPKGNLVGAEDRGFSPDKADPPGAVLLGERQHKFLRDWAGDWRSTDMKLVVSQTIPANASTHIGRGRKHVRADYDTNGWPRSGRDAALREIRRAFAPILCGDQHLATLVQHGVEQWNDSAYSLCVPSIQNYWPRYWEPDKSGANHINGLPPYTGEYLDGFGNKITVWAAANPGPTGREPAKLHDKAPGYGIVRMNCRTRKITMECWPRYADPADPGTGSQYPGWPKTIDQEDNYRRKAVAWLPTIQVEGMANPVIQVIDEPSGEMVYTIRAMSNTWRPKVFREGSYTLKVGEPDTDQMKTLKSIQSVPSESRKRIKVSF